MTNLTWARDGEWGMDGVDLAALPPKLYRALYKLRDLEHNKDDAVEHLAGLYGVDSWWLMEVLDNKIGPWHPVEDLPVIYNLATHIHPSSNHLLVYTEDADVDLGYCELVDGAPKWYKYPTMRGRVTHWMELPQPPVPKMDTGEADT